MKNLEILDQLLKGNHLEPEELAKAKAIIESLALEIEKRLK